MIKSTDYYHSAGILDWLISNIGPQLPHSGTAMIGEGWRADFRKNLDGDQEIVFDLGQHVDEKTRVLFYLKWA